MSGPVIVIDSVGHMATVTRGDPSSGDMLEARLDSGQLIQLPPAVVVRREDGVYTTSVHFDDVLQAGDALVVPLVAESVTVDRRTVETGRVRVTKTVREEQTVIDETLLSDEVDVERREINQMVDSAPQVHYDGDTLVVPLVEEVLVVEKRLVLREEIRITRHQTEKRHTDTVTLRREEAQVERVNAGSQPGHSPQGDEH